ncbi:MAG: FGGY family carbohydrate kinase [Planctomycetota bacterium]|nr:FGGY family carbohydrate kinase [Planctomycetota bacterium]
MHSTSLYLALDQGGSTSRALVFDRAGRVVAKSSVEVATARPAPDRVEQDAEDLVRSLRRAVREVVKQLGRRIDHLAAAGLATQRSSVVAWDKTSGGALAPVLSWQDRRAASRLDGLDEHADEVRKLTGLRLSPHYGATKLAWLLDAVPAVRAAHLDGRLAFGPLASFLASRLLDERPFVVDAANASRTLLLDVASATWSPKLLDLFAVPGTALPRVAPTVDEFGTLDVGPRKIPLRVLTGDQSAAFFASGAPRADVASITFGTGAFVLRATAGAVPDVPGLLTTLVHREKDVSTFALEGTVNGAGSALAWIASELELPELDVESWLEEVREPPLFLNGVGGLGAPWWRADFASRFVGAGDAGAKVVAVLESVVFLVVEILGAMEASQGKPRVLRVGGGLAQLDGLCARLAALSGLPVERHSETETTALGLARLLGAEPEAPMVETFVAEDSPALRARYALWRAEMSAAVRAES